MKNTTSTPVIYLILMVCISILYFFKRGTNHEQIITEEVKQYYGYLPAKIIFNDLQMNKSSYRYSEMGYYFSLTGTKQGKSIFKKNCGWSILYAPFFFPAHEIAKNFEFQPNGFSEPYLIFLLIGSLFYFYLGLSCIQYLLRRFHYSEYTIGITLIVLFLATNLLWYATKYSPLVYISQFAMVSVFAFSYFKLRGSPNSKNYFLLGLSLGILSWVSSILALVFGLFVLIGQFNVAKIKGSFLNLLLVIFPVVLLWIPQVLYWKITTNHFSIPSFPSNDFSLDIYKIWSGLFDLQNGWLINSPILIIALVGIFLLKNELKKYRLTLMVILILFFLFNISVSTNINSTNYGQSGMIALYPLLAVPLASILQKYLYANNWTKFAIYSMFLIFIFINIFSFN